MILKFPILRVLSTAITVFSTLLKGIISKIIWPVNGIKLIPTKMNNIHHQIKKAIEEQALLSGVTVRTTGNLGLAWVE
ncbi:MAG: hypothetical protein WCO53_04800 [Deltaproteobacteria bacterium]